MNIIFLIPLKILYLLCLTFGCFADRAQGNSIGVIEGE